MLEFIKKTERRKNPKGQYFQYGLFLCEHCNQVVERRVNLARIQLSCGCLPARLKHGGAKTKLYYVWASMIARCTREHDKQFHQFGGKGIFVHDKWEKSFSNFRIWAFANGYAEGLELGRFDKDDGYTPSNCRFGTRAFLSRSAKGTKLNWVKVDAIRDIYANSEISFSKLGRIFGVSRVTVSNVVHFITWKYNETI